MQALREKGFDAGLIVEAGMASRPDDGGQPYDAFRDRIMFPIRDPRGRCIGFGGRAMDPDARAKYLNSRETPLFDKGRALYNHGPAREAAGKGQPLIVAEGYMDVIALSRARGSTGRGGAAGHRGDASISCRCCGRSPHLSPSWRWTATRAGLRAAMRLIDLALPMLERRARVPALLR